MHIFYQDLELTKLKYFINVFIILINIINIFNSPIVAGAIVSGEMPLLVEIVSVKSNLATSWTHINNLKKNYLPSCYRYMIYMVNKYTMFITCAVFLTFWYNAVP